MDLKDLTGFGAIFDFASKVVDRLIPDPAQKLAAQQELLKLAISKDLAVMANETSLIKMQTDINLEQAKSPKLFISGPRPALMWVGVLGAAYQWIFLPAGIFLYTTYFGKGLPVPPPEISGDMMLMLGSLMGIQIVARTHEKVKGVAS